MKLKISYGSRDEIPVGYEDLYTEKDGKFVLTGIEGSVDPGSVTRLEEALRKERNDHKATKEKIAKFKDLDPETLQSELDELAELRALKEAGNLGDPTKLEAAVKARLDRETAPLKRDLEKLRNEKGELEKTYESVSQRLRRTRIEAAVQRAAADAKIVPTAVEDVMAIADRLFEVDEKDEVRIKDDVGFVPGSTIGEWLTGEMREKRPHWWPAAAGAGASGSGGGGASGGNPWTHDGWNMTEQGKIIREDPAKAERMAKAAGTKIGGPRPPKKAA